MPNRASPHAPGPAHASGPPVTTGGPGRHDILAPGLDVVFCGLNPASSAEADGHNFSHPSNRFWQVLHQAGFTDVQLRPDQERRLLDFGCGITAAVARPTPRGTDITPDEFRTARDTLEATVQCYAPGIIAFLGGRALAAMTRQPKVPLGEQTAAFAGTRTWVLPNPSGRNLHFTLPALVAAYAELRAAV